MEDFEFAALLDELRSQPREGEGFEFKVNLTNAEDIGEYIDELKIVRVIHGMMDLQAILGE